MRVLPATKHRHIARSTCSLAVLALAAWSSSVALAQSGATGDAQAGTDAAGEEEVLVTAQRRSEQPRKVPITMTVISAEMVENLNITTVDKIGSVTPGLVFETANAFPNMFIRGIGVPNSTPGLEQPVALYIDGAYQPRANGTLVDMVDVANIQVLKGPQGTLYGRNATGGAILVTTADPTDEQVATAMFEYGRFDRVRTQLIANLPINEELAFRIAGSYAREDGFIHNTFTGNDVRGYEGYLIRGKLKWTPSPDFTALLALEYRDKNSKSLAANRQAAGLPFCIACRFGAQITRGFYETRDDFEVTNPEQGRSAHLDLTYEYGAITLKSVTAYNTLDYGSAFDADHTEIQLLGIRVLFGGETFEQSFQVSSDFEGPVNFLAGVQYIHDDAYASNAVFGNLLGIPRDVPKSQQRYTDDDVISDSFALFGEIYWRPIDNLTITLGGRYSTDDREVIAHLSPIAQATSHLSSDTFTQEMSFEKFTPRVVVAYDIEEEFGDLNLYASYTEGFKAGGVSAPLFAPAPLVEPETISSYEMGGKFTSADRKTRVNMAAFYYDYEDIQTSIIDPGNGTKITVNAAKARGQGAELDISHQFFDWLNLSAGVAYLDTEFVSYPNAPQYVIARDASGNPLAFVPGVADLSGHRLPRAPKWTVNLNANVEGPLWSDWIGRLTANVNYTSEYDFVIGAGGPAGLDVQEAMALVNLSGGVGPDSGNYELGFYVDNVFDKEYNYLISTGDFGIDAYAAKPITYGLRVKVRI